MSPSAQMGRCSGVQRCGGTAGCASLMNAMPRGPRLDAPGTLHHVMVRGIERTRIFRDDEDRGDFRTRLAGRAERAAITVSAWALLPNYRAAATRAREGIAHLRVGRFGQSGRRLASVLGVAPQSVYRAAARGSTETAEWARILAR